MATVGVSTRSSEVCTASIRVCSTLSGAAYAQASGSARATLPGAKAKQSACAAAASSGPAGARRPAKYPIQKPMRPTARAARAGSGAK